MANYLRLDPRNEGYVSTPSHVDFDVAGDFVVLCRASLDDLDAEFDNIALARRDTQIHATADFNIWAMNKQQTRFEWFDSSETLYAFQKTLNHASNGFADEVPFWIRFDFDIDSGGGNSTVTVYYSHDQEQDYTSVSWTLLGSSDKATNQTPHHAGSDLTAAGSQGAAKFGPGRLYRSTLIDGSFAGGTAVADFNADDFTVGDGATDTAEDSTGKTWTINGAGSEILSDSDRSGLLLLGVG